MRNPCQFVSGVAHAQDVQEAAYLRSEIRTALMNDPRSATLSKGELSALVEALADETENEGVVYDFVPPRPVQPFSFVTGIMTPWGAPVSEPLLYGVVLVCLGLALLLLKKLSHYHRPRPAL